jgi:UDP-glucose 6-dehydrogenase
MKVTFFETSYAGLVQAAVLAEIGHEMADFSHADHQSSICNPILISQNN